MYRPSLIALVLALVIATSQGIADQRTLTIGVFPRHSESTTLKMFTPLAQYLRERLGLPVELLSATDFPAFWDLLKAGRVDVVHYNQYHYLKAHKLFGHRVILRNEEAGKASIRALIVARGDSALNSIEDLKGRRVLFGGGHDAMVSYILASDVLHQHGLPAGDYLEVFSNTPVGAARDLFFGQADAAGIADLVLTVDATPWKTLSAPPPRILAASEPIALHPWAVTPRVDQDLAERLTRVLLELNNSRAGREILHQAQLTGLRAASDQDYDPVRNIVARVLGEHY
jgi:phosphonate transport system substrate-binding protein